MTYDLKDELYCSSIQAKASGCQSRPIQAKQPRIGADHVPQARVFAEKGAMR